MQKALYSNKDVAHYLLSLDAIDGTFLYAYTSRDDYAICAGILERSGDSTGRFRRVLFYYPEKIAFLLLEGRMMLSGKIHQERRLSCSSW